MNSIRLYPFGFATILLLLSGSLLLAETRSPKATGQPPAVAGIESRNQDDVLGRRVPNFVLADATGQQVALSDFADARILVVVFMGTACPISNAYVPDLIDLQKRYRDRDVRIVGVNSNPADSAESIAAHVKAFKIDFPVLVDEDQLAMDLLGARRTPDAFVLDRRRHIRYSGRIDDRVGYTYKRGHARRSDLEEAIKELLAGKTVSMAETEVQGCLMTRPRNLRKKDEVTYAKQVARIIHRRCANCHHAGTAARLATTCACPRKRSTHCWRGSTMALPLVTSRIYRNRRNTRKAGPSAPPI